MKLLAVASPLIPLFTNISGIKANLAQLEKIAQTDVPEAFKQKAMDIVDVAEQFGKHFLELFNCYQQVHEKYVSNQQFGPAWKEGFNCAKGNLEEVGDVADAVLSAAYDFMFELNQWAVQEHGSNTQHSEL